MSLQWDFCLLYTSQNTKSLLNSNLTDGKFVSAKGKNVVIIGGGDTGNDCVGTAIRQGAKSVTQLDVYKRQHDNCGIGAVVNIKGIKTHETVENALKIVENLKHRAGKDADGKTEMCIRDRYLTDHAGMCHFT